MSENIGDKRWYVVHVRSCFEEQVARGLRERIQLSQLGGQFGEVVIPTEKVLEMRNGKERKVPRKFFPGYVLICMEMNEHTWVLVRKTPNVRGFLGGTSDKPVALSASAADAILQSVQESLDKPRLKVHFEPGQVVKIIDGPFVDFSGVVKEADYEKKNRLLVSVFVFGRATSVELEFMQVEKA